VSDIRVRTMKSEDRHELADLIYISINHWYQTHGRPAIFEGGPEVTDIFFQVYERLDPGCGIVAENVQTGRLMGSCFFHPRPLHVSLGIMNVHPIYFGRGAGKVLLQYIIDFARREGKPLRLTQSAINLDSFSLYNKAGFVPRYAYQDMVLQVPEAGIQHDVPGLEQVREGNKHDVTSMVGLERVVSGIDRELDFRYFLENRDGFWHTSIYENTEGQVDGFMVSCGHPAMNMLGPCVTRTQEHAAALILNELNHHKGRMPVFLVPVECDRLVRTMYEWGALNCELHFCQILGDFQPFRGVNMPTFLPETC